MSDWNLPPGVSLGGPTERAIHRCTDEKCGHEWEASMYYELGGWFYVDDGMKYCPKCDGDGVAIDV